VLALHQIEHPLDRDPRRFLQVLVKAEGEPTSPCPRDGPLDRKVSADVDSDLRFDRALDRGARDLTIALRRMTIASGEERTVDRDR
jgi:hypothetical protein